jgi:hypothetical protein
MSSVMSPVMTICFYLAVGLVILWIAGALASFVKKKTDNTFLSAVTWFASAYLLFEFSLVLLNKLGLNQ